jgi:DNA-binding CsgD family transcriptional regulator/tetratricopeptide (TPR) repeat protein
MVHGVTRPLVGRLPEIAVIDAALAQLAGGRGCAVHIVGEAGIGKTALLDAVEERADAAGFVIRSAAADNSDQRRRLALIVQLLPDVRTATPDVISAVLASIDRLAGLGPPVLLIDDAHWADGASVDVLAAIARRAEQLGLLLVTTARPHPHSIELGRFGAAIDGCGRRMTLDTLTDAEIADLVEATTGARPARSLTHLLADASGNPFLTVELLRALEHDGTLHIEAGSIHLARGAALPPRLGDRLAREAITAAGNDSLLLRAAAVIPGGFMAEELATIVDRPVSTVIGDLLVLSDATVLEERNGRLGFRHDIIRQAIIDATPAPVVRSLNRRAVAALQAANADQARIASCLLAAADPTAAGDLAALIDLGMSLRDEHPFAAIDLLDTALGSLEPGHPRHAEVALALGWVLLDLGRFAEVSTLLTQHFGVEPTGRLDVQLLRGQALSLCGNRRSAVDPVPPGFDIAGSFDTVDARAVAAVAELSTLQVVSGHTQCAVRLVEWVEHSGVAMEPGGVGYLCETQALLHARRGLYEEALAAAQRGMQVAADHPSRATWRARPTLTAAMMLDAMGRSDEALHVLRAAHAEPGPRWNMPLLQFGAAISLYRRGDWDDALAEIAAGLEATEELGMRLGTSWPFALTIAIHCARGERATARTWMDKASDAINVDALGIEWMMYAAALVEEADGATEAAARTLLNVVDAARSLGVPGVVMNLSPDAARLADATDDARGLDMVVSNLAGLADRTRSPVVHAFHDWVTAWQRHDFGLAERAAQAMWACKRRAEAMRGNHDAAVLAAGAGHRSDARRLATVAFAGYEQLRAEQLHARLRAELRAAGVSMRPRRAPPRATAGWDSLTPTERQIVELVADGRMNSEIAEQLFVSRRTVESHLARVYPKMGFPRRAELAVAVRQRREHERAVADSFA